MFTKKNTKTRKIGSPYSVLVSNPKLQSLEQAKIQKNGEEEDEEERLQIASKTNQTKEDSPTCFTGKLTGYATKFLSLRHLLAYRKLSNGQGIASGKKKKSREKKNQK
ncbi:hypothetical protein Csa_007613 [Cucumis sativus]|nr:hypothetical protein Csa_007613 [Cucumis sativus]